MSEKIREAILEELMKELEKSGGNTTDKAIKLTNAYFNSISLAVGNAVGGVNVVSAPFIAAALELYAKAIRESFPECEEVIDVVKKLPGLTEIRKSATNEKRG